MASFSSVFVFFLYSMLMFHPEIEDGFLGDASVFAMVIAMIILALFSWFFIYYSMKAFLEARSKEFGILLMLGLEKKQLGKLLFLETMIIGALSSISGILFGFAFSKFFLMIVREVLDLETLSMYVAWAPFVLTSTVFMSAFTIISFGIVLLSKDFSIMPLVKQKRTYNPNVVFKPRRAAVGLMLPIFGYILAVLTTKTTLVTYVLLIPILVTVGTYYFFSDTIFMILERFRKFKLLNWHKSRMLSVSEQIFMFKQNTKMFFIVTMVSTLAFLCVVLLAALSSYTAQYDKLNPLGIIYKGHFNNPYEIEHVDLIMEELEVNRFSYQLTRFDVIKQTSSATHNAVEVLSQSELNHLLFSYGYPLVHLQEGRAMFIGHSDEAVRQLTGMRVETVLVENSVPLVIDEVYPEILFSSEVISTNSIVVSDLDYNKLVYPYGKLGAEPGYRLYAFDIPQWVKAKDVGYSLHQSVSMEMLTSPNYDLPFYFENAGLDYLFIKATYAMFTIVGLLVVVVFLFAAGSFIYFKLYANLERERQQYAVLKRLGLTNREMKRLVNNYLMPQFFLPWGVALVHSVFAFLALQSLLKDVMNLIIVKEIAVVFTIFFVIQIVYFYLLKWRYIAHVNEPN